MTLATEPLPPVFLDIQREWCPEDVILEETLVPHGARLFSAVLDVPSPVKDVGDVFPPMWHWFSFRPVHAGSELGDDGHPADGDFMPPLARRRRMFGGGRLEVHEPLRCGEHAVRRSSLVKVRARQGVSGPLLITTVRHEVSVDGEVRVVEEQDHVYRRPEDVTGHHLPDYPSGDAPCADLSLTFRTDPVCLFRFSCATANAHRIHYDTRYTTEVEGYPSLVVHGPLLALLMLELARRAALDVTRFRWRASAPSFVGETIRALGRRRGGVLRLQAGAAGSWERVVGDASMVPRSWES